MITKDELEKRLRLTKRLLIIAYLCFFIILMLFSLAVLKNYQIIGSLKKSGVIPQENETIKDINVTINFTDLNEHEVRIAKNLIISNKDIYLLPQRSITFAHNISSYYGADYRENIVAFNRFRGEIYVKWRNNTRDNTISLCHEELHTFFLATDDAHKTIYDLSDYLPCFEETEI